MDIREIIGAIVIFLSTMALWVAAAQEKKDPITWSGYVVAAAIASVMMIAVIVTEAQKFTDFVGNAAYAAGKAAAEKAAGGE